MPKGKLFVALFKKELLGLIRSKQLIIMGALFLFFGIMAPVAARFVKEIVAMAGVDVGNLIPDPTYMDSVAQFVKNTAQLLSLILIFLFMGIMATEKSRKTAHFVLVKPVSRIHFFLAKLFTLWVAVLVCNIVSGFLCYGYTLLIFGEIPFPPFLSMLLMLTIYLLFLVTLITCCSTIFKTSAQSALVTFLFWISLVIEASLPKIGKFSPAFLIGLSENQFIQVQWPWQPLLATIVLALVMIVIALGIFRKWEP